MPPPTAPPTPPPAAPPARAWRAFLLSALAGGLIWAASPWLGGPREPWDADGFSYLAALVGAGALAGLAAPKPLWAHYAGAVAGQLAYELAFLPVGPLVLLGVGFLLAYSLVFAVAAALAGSLRRRVPTRRGRP